MHWIQHTGPHWRLVSRLVVEVGCRNSVVEIVFFEIVFFEIVLSKLVVEVGVETLLPDLRDPELQPCETETTFSVYGHIMLKTPVLV